MITIGTIKFLMATDKNPVKKVPVGFSGRVFALEESIAVKLSDGTAFTIPKEFVWYYVSMPWVLRLLCPGEQHAELPYIIYEYLYRYRKVLGIDKKFANRELYKWLHTITGTKWPSRRNLDNRIHYYMAIRSKNWKINE